MQPGPGGARDTEGMEGDTQLQARGRLGSFSNVRSVRPCSSEPRTAPQHLIPFSKNLLQSFKFAFSAFCVNFPHLDFHPAPTPPPGGGELFWPRGQQLDLFGCLPSLSCLEPPPILLKGPGYPPH